MIKNLFGKINYDYKGIHLQGLKNKYSINTLDDPPELSCKNRLHQTILARILERSYLASPEKSQVS